MALESTELVQYARDAATRGDDLYALLNVDATTPKEDIHRAWRRAGLKYHPDKAGENYDAAKYESFERARDVLVDAAAREAYDNGLKAVLQKRKRVEEMSSERRRFVEELERAEREAKRRKTGGGREEEGLSAAEKNRAAEAGRRRMEERARLMREAEERSRMREKSSKEKSQEPSAPGTPVAAATPRRPIPMPDVAGNNGADTASTHAADSTSPKDDEYESKIAELERKLKEKRERKAAKKAGRKSDVSGLSTRWSPSAEGDPTIKPPDGEKAESKADGEKGTPKPTKTATSSFAFRPPYAASAPTSPAVGKQQTGGSTPSFASTMARLKAAQMKRDEEKRKREAEAAASTSGATPAAEQQAV